MDPKDESLKRAGERLSHMLGRLSPAGQAAFFSGEMPLDAGEGWVVQVDAPNGVLRWNFSALRAYEAEQTEPNAPER